jgi:dihydrofolate reductase
MMITLIAAIDERNAIGYKGKLLYWLPNDLKRFKQLTTGHTIIMGRHTFLSLPKGALPNRRNVVLSSQPDASFEGAELFPSLYAALQSCQPDEEIYIIGGASVYLQAIRFADRLSLTEIEASAELADAFFPDIDRAVWHQEKRETFPPDERNPYAYSFVDYVRR